MATPKGEKLLAEFEELMREYDEFNENVRLQLVDRWAMGQITTAERDEIVALQKREIKKWVRQLQRLQKDIGKAVASKEARNGKP
jgi:hypothetical protein